MKFVKTDTTSTTQSIQTLIMAWVMPKHVFKSFLVGLKIYFVIFVDSYEYNYSYKEMAFCFCQLTEACNLEGVQYV